MPTRRSAAAVARPSAQYFYGRCGEHDRQIDEAAGHRNVSEAQRLRTALLEANLSEDEEKSNRLVSIGLQSQFESTLNGQAPSE
jgi:hypothetical protein